MTNLRPTKVLFPLGLGTALSLMGDATLYTVLPTHTAEAGVALGSVGVLLGANRAVRILSNGPSGLLYDRSRRRRIFVPSLFVGALSTAIYAVTRGFWPLLLGRLLWGLAWSGIWVGGATIILDVTTETNRGRWTGLYQTWFFLGAALGAFVGGLLTDELGYGTTMWIGAVVTTFGGAIALLALPETKGLPPTAKDDFSQAKPALNLRKNRTLWVVVMLQGLNRFVIAGVLYATLALVVQEQMETIRLGPGVATLTGALVAGRTLLSTVSAPLSGTLSDWLGGRWGATVFSLALGAISMTLVAGNAPVVILLGVSLGAVTAGSLQTLIIALIGDMAVQNQRGRAIGLLHTLGDVGSAAGPPMAYALLPELGLQDIYLICAALFALGIIPTLWAGKQSQTLRRPTN